MSRTLAFFLPSGILPRTRHSGAPRTPCRPRRSAPPCASVSLPDPLPLVSVPNESHMLTPGEVREISLDYSLFSTLLKHDTTTFGLLPPHMTTPSRGVCLSILRVLSVSHAPPPPRVAVECRCASRFDLKEPVKGPMPRVWSAWSAPCARIHDEFGDGIAARAALADLEWKVWTQCRETADMMRRVRDGGVVVDQELAVWAPREYDRDVDEADWNKTPRATKEVWWRRAECFSFGVLRCMECEAEVMMRARDMQCCIERLQLAISCIHSRRARTSAELSLKNALE